ncbi:MAG TPA: hypothetical protein VMF08_23500 [Candidatus Sulfotelmatobacter sp.]|nr:hypothetical protein [Candidatus Sulfotelmatobacter sp.]
MNRFRNKCAATGLKCLLAFCISYLPLSNVFGNPLPGDQHWDSQFGFVGTSDESLSINVLGGKVYVGGWSVAAGNTAANYIAGYDGTNWFQLNNGVSGYYNLTFVQALANDGTNLYVGGIFTNADDSGAINIARWDGSSFHPLPGGAPNSEVEAIKIAGPNFYAAGEFTSIGSVSANRIAGWNGTGWVPLGAGLTGGSGLSTYAAALEYDGTYLYAGGNFGQAGTVAANNIARWNGNAWSAMGSGFSGPVLALCSVGGTLYAGGNFTNASLSITNLARWNGSSWSAVGAGPNRTVESLVTDGTNLYVGGLFTNINGVAANHIAMWDGANWHALGTGIQGSAVYGMALDSQGRLFVAGNFNQAGNVGASYVAGWDGTNWFALGATTSKGMTHFDGVVQSLTSDGTNIYAGGIFTEAGSQIANQVARWDGTNWWPLGATNLGALPEAGPDAFTFADGDLFAGGDFTNLGPYSIDRIGFWDGTEWNDIEGVDNTVEALAYDGVRVWVGGAFTNVETEAGGGYTPGLAYYDFNLGYWYTAGYIPGSGQTVSALGWDGINGNMYVGGSFTSVYTYSDGVSVPANNIAVFSEVTGEWSALGGGVNGTVDAILVTNGIVYVGGDFTTAGGLTVNGIAEWNGSTWSALGSGVTGYNSLAGTNSVNALAMNGNILYAAGAFTNAGGVYAAGIAAWNGSTWTNLGSGFNYPEENSIGYANALFANGNDLYAGGDFTFAGSKPSTFIAHWNNQLDYYPPPNPYLTREAALPGGQFQFRLAGTSGESYILEASTNLVQWTSLLTNSATLYDFTDTNAAHFPNRFYRAVLGP